MKYRIFDYQLGYPAGSTVLAFAYYVQVKFLFFWVTVRKFVCYEDNGYAKRCAEELYEKLTEKI